MERRRHHRVRMDDSTTADIVLTGASSSWRVDAELVDLSAGGASVRVHSDHMLQLTVGGTLTVWVADAASGIELPIGAKMVHRREDANGRVLGLQFTDLRTVGALLQPLFGQKFNRRGAFRVVPGRHEGPVNVTLYAPPELRQPPSACALVDLSTGGMAVDVPVAFETGLQGHEQLQLVFRLPTGSASLIADGRVVHRTLRGELVRFGIQFQHTDEADFRPVHDAILAYVIKRQRESAEEFELNGGGGIPLGALGRVAGSIGPR
jgi:c-di-GMP-binding flagellar brake protein YcgR